MVSDTISFAVLYFGPYLDNAHDIIVRLLTRGVLEGNNYFIFSTKYRTSFPIFHRLFTGE